MATWTQFVPSLAYVEEMERQRWYFPGERFGMDSVNHRPKQAQDLVNRLGLLIESGIHPDTAIKQLDLKPRMTDSYPCPKNGLMEWRVVNVSHWARYGFLFIAETRQFLRVRAFLSNHSRIQEAYKAEWRVELWDEKRLMKLSAVPKRRRLDEDERYDVHSCTHLNKIYTSYETTDPGHHGESLVRDPTDQGGKTATTRSRRRSKPDKRRRCRKLCVFKHYNMCTSTVNPDNIVNLSSYRLSNRETDILSKGLSFIPYTPNINYIKSSEIIDFTNKLRLRYKYMHITPSDNPFRLKTKQTPGPTDYKPLEKLIHINSFSDQVHHRST